MLENFNGSNKAIMEDGRKAIDAECSVWDVDDEVEKILRKKHKKIKRLKKKLKRGHGSKKKLKKKIKSLKKQLKALQDEKGRQEDRLKSQLMQVNHQNDMLRLLCVLQTPGGKEYFLKQVLGYSSRGFLEDKGNA